MAYSNTIRALLDDEPAKPAFGRYRQHAFTLVELLVAMAIVVVLVAVLLPALRHVKIKGQAASTSSLITSLDQACRSYSQDNNNLYPGQTRDMVDQMDLSHTSRLTGTQIMAAALLGMGVDSSGKWFADVHAKYLDIDMQRIDYPMGPDGVDNSLTTAQTVSGARYTIMDAFSDSKPILYYPSRPGKRGNGLNGVFDFEDNARGSAALYPEPSRQDAFYEMILKDGHDPNSQVDDEMRGQDSFLIISAGADGKYFSYDIIGEKEIDGAAHNVCRYDDLLNVNLDEVLIKQ